MVKEYKINKLLQTLPKRLVLLPSWLVSQGYPYELQQRYRKSGWLKSIGNGAMLRNGDALALSGAVAALQTQTKVDIHVGGRSALEWQGLAHYLQMGNEEVTLFVDSASRLPVWFTCNYWNMGMKCYTATLFKRKAIGLTDYNDGELTLKISGAARAIMECLSLCSKQFPLTEAGELMEGLVSLRPAVVQELLEQCTSVKVKRLFLYFAEKIGHSWFKYLDTSNIDLGTGNRSLTAEGGVFVSKYKLVLPKEIAI